MIVVTMELWPGGDESQKRHLGTAVIGNDGTGNARRGNYDVWLSRQRFTWQPRWWKLHGPVWRAGRVEGFPRTTFGAWDLLCRALLDTVGERNLLRSASSGGSPARGVRENDNSSVVQTD